MGPESELGPLDLQLEHPTAEGIRISALDGVRPVEYFASTAMDLAFKLGRWIRQEIQLSRRDSIEIALAFASDYVAPLLSQLDPAIVAMCWRELDVAGRYARELLPNHMLKDYRGDPIERAKQIADCFVWEYPTHGYVIDRNEAKRLHLNVIDAANYKSWDDIWTAFLNLLQLEEGIWFVPEQDLQSFINDLSQQLTSEEKPDEIESSEEGGDDTETEKPQGYVEPN